MVTYIEKEKKQIDKEKQTRKSITIVCRVTIKQHVVCKNSRSSLKSDGKSQICININLTETFFSHWMTKPVRVWNVFPRLYTSPTRAIKGLGRNNATLSQALFWVSIFKKLFSRINAFYKRTIYKNVTILLTLPCVCQVQPSLYSFRLNGILNIRCQVWHAKQANRHEHMAVARTQLTTAQLARYAHFATAQIKGRLASMLKYVTYFRKKKPIFGKSHEDIV